MEVHFEYGKWIRSGCWRSFILLRALVAASVKIWRRKRRERERRGGTSHSIWYLGLAKVNFKGTEFQQDPRNDTLHPSIRKKS